MRKTLLLALLLPLSLLSQTNYTISGYVRDASNGEELIGVNIVIPELKVGATTNVYGYYSLSIPEGQYNIQFQYIGYKTHSQTFQLKQNLNLDLEMQPSSTELQEVEVTDEKIDQNITSVEMSVAKLDVKEIQKVPNYLVKLTLSEL